MPIDPQTIFKSEVLMGCLRATTPPSKRSLKLLSSGKVAVLIDSDQAGIYLISTLQGERLLSVLAFKDTSCFTSDGRIFPRVRVLGLVHILISEEKTNHVRHPIHQTAL